MRVKFGIAVLSSIALLLIGTVMVRGQQKAAVAMSSLDGVRAGGPITFTVTLNQRLPTGARFDLRVSPLSADEELDLGSGQPVKDSTTTFRVAGTMPQNAVAGEWHISVVCFFCQGPDGRTIPWRQTTFVSMSRETHTPYRRGQMSCFRSSRLAVGPI